MYDIFVRGGSSPVLGSIFTALTSDSVLCDVNSFFLASRQRFSVPSVQLGDSAPFYLTNSSRLLSLLM